MNQNKAAPPKPSKIVRKLKLSRVTVAPLAPGETPEEICLYTHKLSGCGPAHTADQRSTRSARACWPAAITGARARARSTSGP